MTASPRLAPGSPSRERRTKSAGGAGRRREGARARRFTRQTSAPLAGCHASGGAGDWRRCAANAPLLGRRPTVAPRGSIDHARRRIPGTKAPGPEHGSRERHETAVLPGMHEVRGFARAACINARDRARSLAGAGFQGDRSPGEHRPDDLTLARAGVAARTDSRGEQSFEVGVPAVYRRARRSRVGQAAVGALRRVRRTGPGGREEPSSRPVRPARLRASRGKGSARRGKHRSSSGSPRRRRSNANPQGSNGPRERVRLLERGKL